MAGQGTSVDPVAAHAHASRAQITVDDDPIFGSDQAFEQKRAVAGVAGQYAAAAGAVCLQMREHR